MPTSPNSSEPMTGACMQHTQHTNLPRYHTETEGDHAFLLVYLQLAENPVFPFCFCETTFCFSLVIVIMLNLTLADSAPALHPHLLVTPPRATSRSGCSYNVSLTLPDAVFIDRDEISDLWPRDQVAWTLSPDKIDIERPVRDDAERVHFSVQLGPDVRALDIPLHTRYLRPNVSGRQRVDVVVKNSLQAGWACGGHAGERITTQR